MAHVSDRHHAALVDRLEAGEVLVAAAGAIVATRRHRQPGLPRHGFVLAVTSTRLVAFAVSPWRVVPGEIVASWRFDEGAVLVRERFGRARLVLPDRSTAVLAPYGGWSLRALTD